MITSVYMDSLPTFEVPNVRMQCSHGHDAIPDNSVTATIALVFGKSAIHCSKCANTVKTSSNMVQNLTRIMRFGAPGSLWVMDFCTAQARMVDGVSDDTPPKSQTSTVAAVPGLTEAEQLDLLYRAADIRNRAVISRHVALAVYADANGGGSGIMFTKQQILNFQGSGNESWMHGAQWMTFRIDFIALWRERGYGCIIAMKAENLANAEPLIRLDRLNCTTP
jgi:hypothetical protein